MDNIKIIFVKRLAEVTMIHTTYSLTEKCILGLLGSGVGARHFCDRGIPKPQDTVLILLAMQEGGADIIELEVP